jgi:hypothetical protein
MLLFVGINKKCCWHYFFVQLFAKKNQAQRADVSQYQQLLWLASKRSISKKNSFFSDIRNR